jgi:hypothetical protein
MTEKMGDSLNTTKPHIYKGKKLARNIRTWLFSLFKNIPTSVCL